MRYYGNNLKSPPPIGVITAGTIRAKFDEDLEPATDSISVNQCAGGVINNIGQDAANADITLTLPAAAEGYHFTVVLGDAQANFFKILTLNSANDKIYLDGVAGTDDGYVSIAAAVVGACIQFFTFQTAAGVYDWYACTVSGAWVAG